MKYIYTATCYIIRIDTLAYRAATDTRAVRKNVSLPAWMAALAEKRGVNCSQVLQDGLIQLLNVSPSRQSQGQLLAGLNIQAGMAIFLIARRNKFSRLILCICYYHIICLRYAAYSLASSLPRAIAFSSHSKAAA